MQGLEEALTATESVAWRGRGTAQGLGLSGKLLAFMSGEESRIKIIVAPQVPMGGASGLVPVSIRNGSRHAVEVRLNASVLDVPGRTAQLTIGNFQDLVKVQPQQIALVRLPVSSAPIGPTAIQLSLTTANKRTLLLEPTTAHRRVDQVRPRDLVPHRRRDRRPRPHLRVPRRPAVGCRLTPRLSAQMRIHRVAS